MANPLPASRDAEYTNAFRTLKEAISKDLPSGERKAAMAALVLLRGFLDDVHTIAVMAKRQQGVEKSDSWNEGGW